MEREIKRMPLFLAAPIGWYAEIIPYTAIELINETPFLDRTYRNKLEFTGVSGKQSFTVPLVKQSRKADYRSVEISYQEHWQNRLINALRTSYGKSPFFEYYDYRFEPILKEKYQYLWDLNLALLEISLSCLKIENKIIESKGLPINEGFGLKKSTEYYQVFADKNGFEPNLSIFDLIYNVGLGAFSVLENVKNKSQEIK